MAAETIETEQIHPEKAHHLAPAKWAALVDDNPIPMPERRVKVEVLKTQSSVPEGRILVRDHNSPEDVILSDGGIVDLAEGNVFYSLAACECHPRPECSAPAKRALFVNDKPEITVRPDQTGKSVRELFNLPLNSNLIRDHEGIQDEPISVADTLRFEDGPVFYVRQVKADLSITVNARVFTEHDGVRKHMIGREIASLVYPECPNETRIWFVSDGGREVGLDERVEIQGCEVFDVVRKKVDGGYEGSRVDVELSRLRSGGQEVAHHATPVPLVIYRGLRGRPGTGEVTDVLVPVPTSYPGQMIDWAYLPNDSPLIGRVKGSPQENRISCDGRIWRQISYHPHNGGGAPSWNPAIHGFHTYLGELLSWLYNAN